MGKNKHLQYLRRESRSQVREHLNAILKPEPKNFLAKWIYRFAVLIVIEKPEK